MHDEIYSDDPSPLTVEEAWAVGLFEGEGCLTIGHVKQRNRIYSQPRLKLNSTDEDVVRRFHRIVEFGTVVIDTAQERRGWKRQWSWIVGNRLDVEDSINKFYHHLSLRRQIRAGELLVACENRASAS